MWSVWSVRNFQSPKLFVLSRLNDYDFKMKWNNVRHKPNGWIAMKEKRNDCNIHHSQAAIIRISRCCARAREVEKKKRISAATYMYAQSPYRIACFACNVSVSILFISFTAYAVASWLGWLTVLFFFLFTVISVLAAAIHNQTVTFLRCVTLLWLTLSICVYWCRTRISFINKIDIL